MQKPILLFGARDALSVLAKSQVQAFTKKDGTFVSAHTDSRAAAGPKPKAAGRKPLHHQDLEEGDELVSPKGEKHEYSHSKRGIGRHVVEMRSGHNVPTERDGTMPGWKKTGRNNVTGKGF